jgi:acyl CoA:acetate/3-ketoacid CoA transferase beta subunit
MAAPHGASPPEGDDNYRLIDAGMHPVALLRGAVFFHHADSFAMMRGGRVPRSNARHWASDSSR